MKLNDIWICLGLSMVLFVMPKPLSVGADMLSEHFFLRFAP
jgi:hypothetical protein